jgi:hypothetical protein
MVRLSPAGSSTKGATSNEVPKMLSLTNAISKGVVGVVQDREEETTVMDWRDGQKSKRRLYVCGLVRIQQQPLQSRYLLTAGYLDLIRPCLSFVTVSLQIGECC